MTLYRSLSLINICNDQGIEALYPVPMYTLVLNIYAGLWLEFFVVLITRCSGMALAYWCTSSSLTKLFVCIGMNGARLVVLWLLVALWLAQVDC